MTKTATIAVPLVCSQRGIGKAIIDRELWTEDDVIGSLRRQIARDEAEGVTVPAWIVEYAQRGDAGA